MTCYARFLVQHPLAVLLGVSLLAAVCCVVPLLTRKLPDFTDPTLGFETRGTEIAERLISWENLIEETRPSGSLAVNPQDIQDRQQFIRSQNDSVFRPKARNGKRKRPKDNAGKKKFKPKQSISNVNRILYTELLNNSSGKFDMNGTMEEHEHWGYGKNLTYLSQENVDGRMEHTRRKWVTLKNMETAPSMSEHHHLSSDGFFCGVPLADYAHVVFTSLDGSSLMTAENLRSICALQEQLEWAGAPEYHKLCQQSRPPGPQCCPSWSLPNYVALLTSSSSCATITDDDVTKVLELLLHCSSYFHSLKLAPDCEAERCTAPPSCYKYNAVFSILSYLVDADFLPPNNSMQLHVHSSMVFLPLACSASILPFYRHIEDITFQHNNVSIVAMNLGVKNAVFDSWLVRDTWLVGVGGLFVVCCMWLYSGSFLLTVAACLAIVYSTVISYFLYTIVFNLNFFPFMNLLTAVVAVGIGADDMFIFMKFWQSCRGPSQEALTSLGADRVQLEARMADTLQHAVLTMAVTSLTTAAAFYASLISRITAVSCFSLFTGTVVLVNFVMMITWLPASVAFLETCCSSLKNKSWEMKLRPMRQALEDTWSMMSRFLVISVLRLRWLWLLLLGALAALSGVAVIYYPGLKLPDSRSFQLFHSSQTFEQYDLVYRDNYWFERSNKEWGSGNKMPLRWVWGVAAKDSGFALDPASHGELTMDDSFDAAAPESQRWLLGFCARLKGQPFYQPVLGPLLPNCFIENFVTWMNRRCLDEIDNIDRTPCCETSQFPYSRDVFDACLVQAISALYQTPREYFMPGVAGPKFLKPENSDVLPKMAALVVEFESSYSFSVSYEAMEKFYVQVENWTRTEMLDAPEGMKNGWFVSELQFYDLQRTLSRGTLMAIGVSMGVALCVLLIVTLNVLISLYAIVTITLSISVTVGSLVMMGWRLNVLESLAISTAIGLAVDFSLHMGLAYRRAEGNREARSARALAAAAPPTAMAALTTGVAGVLMLPARVLPYTQIGIFLAVVMVVSWTFATFFLGSLLRVAGPVQQFGQFQYPRLKRGRGTTSSMGSEAEGVAARVRPPGPLRPGEGHELQHLARAAHRPPAPHDQSPSATSAITIVLAIEDGHK